MKRELMEFDVLIIGAGPAGLSAAIKLAQLSQQQQCPLSICVIDKAKYVGAHTLSGAVLEPRTLSELIPDWQTQAPPLHTPVIEDQFILLTEKKSWRLPTPPQMHNKGNFIISLSQFCKWLAEQAENLGVNIFPGFAAVDIIYEDNKVVGIITDDKGLDKTGKPKSNFQPGIELRAKQTIFAEGCRGSLSQRLINHYQLNQDTDGQTYALGIKEVWQIPEKDHQSGLVIHTIGWPLDTQTYGGSFLYYFGKDLLSIGFVIGLDYRNPYLNPYEEFQRFKTHPMIYSQLKKSKRIAYGARTLVEGGIQSLPKLTFPGGLLIGDAAGFLNVPKIKGIHTAMKSAILAAESIFAMLQQSNSQSECISYSNHLKSSWLWEELYHARNIRPAMRWGLYAGLAYAAIDTYLFRSRAPWTFHHAQDDHLALLPAASCNKIHYPAHDNEVTFDLTTSVFFNTHRTR